MRSAAAMLLGALALPIQAQSLESMFRAAINARGEDCPVVTQKRPIGVDSRTEIGYIAVACSNGKRYVVALMPDDTLKYHSTCTVWQIDNPSEKCFP